MSSCRIHARILHARTDVISIFPFQILYTARYLSSKFHTVLYDCTSAVTEVIVCSLLLHSQGGSIHMIRPVATPVGGYQRPRIWDAWTPKTLHSHSTAIYTPGCVSVVVSVVEWLRSCRVDATSAAVLPPSLSSLSCRSAISFCSVIIDSIRSSSLFISRISCLLAFSDLSSERWLVRSCCCRTETSSALDRYHHHHHQFICSIVIKCQKC